MRTRSPISPREGVVLLVVLTMLALFAAVGLSFVFFAESEATNAKIYRQSAEQWEADIEPEQLLNYFLNELIFDTDNPYSAMRGGSLSRNLLGYKPDSANVVPYNGIGRLSHQYPPGDPNFAGQDDINLINYQRFDLDGITREPERNPADPTKYVPGNVPWTYPDMNNLFLAAVNADGAVLAPSFHRPWNGVSFSTTAPKAHRYMTLRPHPNYHNQFPAPADAGGDVKNFEHGPGTLISGGTGGNPPQYANNDSYWIDLGFPVLTTPTGQKYKPLFAPLILDLDGKINLNVAGNLLNGGTAYAGNQGWGPWEMNPQHVLGSTEGANFLKGASGVAGRYGGSTSPTKNPSDPQIWSFPGGSPDFNGCKIPCYAQVDFTGAAAAPLTLPTGKEIFPKFVGYNNTTSAGHAALYNPLNPSSSNTVFHPFQMEALARFRGTGSHSLSSDFFRLAPSGLQNRKNQLMVTPISYDFDRAGQSPWNWSFTAPNAVAAGGAPTWAPGTVPDANLLKNAVPVSPSGTGSTNPYLPNHPVTDFTSERRSILAEMSKLNLNRYLPPYPHMGSIIGLKDSPPSPPSLYLDPANYDNTTPALDLTKATTLPRFDETDLLKYQFKIALQARQTLANGVYRRLLHVTGLPPVAVPKIPTPEELRPRRWLAQLAVNIVDFIDEDDLITPFQFYDVSQDGGNIVKDMGDKFDEYTDPLDPDAKKYILPKYWVYGNEIPKVVLNEVMAQYQLPGDGTMDGNFHVRVWAELFNPWPSVGTATGNVQAAGLSPVKLHIPAGASTSPYSPYRILVAQKNNAGALMLHDKTVDGENTVGGPKAIRTRLDDFPASVKDLDGKDWPTEIKPQTYFLVGPASNPNDSNNSIDPKRVPPPAPSPLWHQSDLMRYRVYFDKNTSDWQLRDGGGAVVEPKIDDKNEGVVILLQRLANPYLPEEDKPFNDLAPPAGKVNWTYNPYITVDYVEMSLTELNITNGMKELKSKGRIQPFQADGLEVQKYSNDPNETQHTLGLTNDAANSAANKAKYDWLAHLDRPLISVGELLQVSGFPPHQLTKKFITGGAANKHRVDWFDSNKRLYGLFETVGTQGRMAGNRMGGRVAGKVNVNDIWDKEVLQSIVSPTAGNCFATSDVDQAFQELLNSRSPGMKPGGGDRPFRGNAPGHVAPGGSLPNGLGIGDTLLRSGSSGPVFQLPNPTSGSRPHTYQQFEMFTKLANNVTTRSNTFALWLTVGFFEVVDDTARPAKLGKEIGKDEGRNLRRRMFAILDRSQLGIPGPQLSTTATSIGRGKGGGTGVSVPITVSMAGGAPAGYKIAMPANIANFEPKPGMRLTVKSELTDTNADPTQGPTPMLFREETVDIISVTGTYPNYTVKAFFGFSHDKKTRPDGSVSTIDISLAGTTDRIFPEAPQWILGNPGPQPRFDARDNTKLVPYFSIIQ